MIDTRHNPEHYYHFGDMYDALGACDQLKMVLSRLHRKHLLDDDTLLSAQADLRSIRTRLEERLNSAALEPKGPRLN